ncbi:Putative lumazine-binding [Ekhidna lutea]|uniref:Putative lumazine-binding n=1 Tax=Ekhidna lutea TaxID=447679 RepID=A0A239JLB6_EKHLU|nr:nuclear transport factor 2 family protein [Ekhidna lutea]SNT06637.1 Putative lumazine-binding [Ekhidna lutea]
MKKLLLFILICTVPAISSAQSDEKETIMKVINQVFEAMRTRDSTLLKQCFTEAPNTFTAFINQEGESKLSIGDFSRFVNAVGQPKEQVWNEPIWNEKVEIDGNLASVWVDYAFYVDDQFSHCGVDAFHLIKRDDGWKIFHLVDTRRKTGCEVPDEFKP